MRSLAIDEVEPGLAKYSGGASDSRGAILVYGVILSTAVLQLFAVPGVQALSLGLVACLALVGWAYAVGFVRVDALRLCAYLLARIMHQGWRA